MQAYGHLTNVIMGSLVSVAIIQTLSHVYRSIPIVKRGGSCGHLMFSLLPPWTIYWINSQVTGDLRRHDVHVTYRQTSNIRGTLVGNKLADHSDVFGASPVGAAPTTSSFSTQHPQWIGTNTTTSNGSWRQGIKGEMTCTVYVALVWNIIHWIIMIIMIIMIIIMIMMMINK